MLKTIFSLIHKKQLTHDVFALTYRCDDLARETPKAGQYVLFQLAPGLNRAYSMASFTEDTFTLIIKRVPDGKGSPLICDAEIGSVFAGMLPLWHFVLRETPFSKCFIGTGTWFAPLYCQLLWASNFIQKPEKIAFVFGVRSFIDSFYESEISEIGQEFSLFQYTQYFSREPSLWASHKSPQLQGYVTDWITKENILPYQEFYVCGSPAMVKSAREKLEALHVAKESIFFEQF